MLNARPPHRPAIGSVQPVPRLDHLWKSTWPYTSSNIIAASLILFGLALFGLEIAFVAEMQIIDTRSAFTSGVGIWSGFFVLMAGIVVLAINCVNRVRILAMVSFGLTVIATCFAIIALSINAYRVSVAVKVGDFFPIFRSLLKLAAAELAIAIVEFLLTVAFIGIYVAVYIRISRQSKQPHQEAYPIA